jgi:glycosyltransferase involved in cell wall biosynthesis
VTYSGNHSPVHPLDTLMRAAERLKDDKSIAFCFVGGGSEFKRVQRWAEVGKRANVLCLPYQLLNQLSASLSAADAHVIIMGNAMLGIVHPCKIYNALAVNVPVIYIGPRPSHVTEILDKLGDEHLAIRVAHGEAETLADQIQNLQQKTAGVRRPLSKEVSAAFSKGVLLPELIGLLEDLRDD